MHCGLLCVIEYICIFPVDNDYNIIVKTAATVYGLKAQLSGAEEYTDCISAER